MRCSITSFAATIIGLGLLTQTVALPEALSDFNRMAKRDPITQGSMMRGLNGASQAQVWIDRLEAYRAESGTLTQEQHDILTKGTEILTSRDKSGLADLKQAAIDAFGFDEAKKLLTSLGKNSERRSLTLDARQTPYCECSSADNWCDGGLQCIKKSKTCILEPNDCGTFWSDDCDGLCYDQ